jgi:hypothetical protein
MKRILPAIFWMASATMAAAQCSVDTIPLAVNNGGMCYIDNFYVDANPISLSSGYQSTRNSFQSFSSPYVMLRQGEMSWFDISFNNTQNTNVCVWIDYDNNGVYSSTELVIYEPNTINPFVFVPIGVPLSVLPDTVHMRIAVQQGVPGWGPGVYDACNAPGIGEIEDYKVIIQCAYPQQLNFDPMLTVCYADSIQLNAWSSADVAWYTGTPMSLQHIGSGFFLHTPVSTTDTTVYVQFASPGCFSGPIDSMMITINPSPVANILGPDTIRSCNGATISATPGPYEYTWNTADTGSTITITNGFGGDLILSVVAPNGCGAQDRIYANIATAPPATYTQVIPGSGFCYNLETYLMYDSAIVPGTCAWYSYPSNTYIGTGSAILQLLPDTGVYQFMAIVNSVCGVDTMIHTFNADRGATYDSLTVLNATQDPSGTYVFCYGNTGFINVVLSGLEGTVNTWIITDTTSGFSIPWNDDTTLALPTAFAQNGHVYTAAALLINSFGCYDTTEIVTLRPANTINFNLSDSAWTCSFPFTLGFSPVNYGVYDFLWSTGDTTNAIVLNAPTNVTLYAIDHATGCITYDTTYAGDASLQMNMFADTTYSCNGAAHFDASFVNYSVDYWDEFDLNWQPINNSSNSDYTVVSNSDAYVVFQGYNSHACYIHDTTYVNYNGAFTFSLGPDITTAITPVTLSGPYGYGVYNYMWQPVNSGNPSIQVNSSGTYTLTVDNGQGCIYQDEIVVNILPMAITSSSSSDIQIMPNPADDQLNVRSSEIITAVIIYDIDGRLVSTQICNSQQAEISTQNLPEGCYILEVNTDSGASRNRIVVQH